MTTVLIFWLLIGTMSVLGLTGLIGGALRMQFGTRFTAWDWSFVWAIVITLVLSLALLNYWDDPGLYTHPIGSPLEVTVSKLTYLNGDFGRTDRVRVDTDRGVYFLPAEARVPASGALYRVTRSTGWSNSTQTFLCPSLTATKCWAVLDPMR